MRRVELQVKAAPFSWATCCLKSATLGIAAEQQSGSARKFFGLHNLAILQSDPSPRRDIATGFDDTIVAQRDADPGVGPDEAALANSDPLFSPA